MWPTLAWTRPGYAAVCRCDHDHNRPQAQRHRQAAAAVSDDAVAIGHSSGANDETRCSCPPRDRLMASSDPVTTAWRIATTMPPAGAIVAHGARRVDAASSEAPARSPHPRGIVLQL